ncbi:LysR family transcriptional regulator [Mangrovibacterium marinum]|uniref:DNA-binding transcriptional LysR family regulator n=1 Tax=Mangrovibacterium marinum TaxID=1639118 RepID=A0A2T5C1B0_9BACT|nr:LysR family transcriptional regulator [Mangrovibacterium marinum]PTN08418.1 DNA-binding transcriptional LysR family regulator [Mangrovibacterium marinum]
MDYRDEVFMAVAEKLSFSKAAEELFISQPAVTKHVKELENKLNTALFDRKGNKIYLTQAGKLAYQHFKRIRELYGEMEFELGRLNDAHRGLLQIGASSTISQYVLPAVLAAFHQRYPQIKLDLFNGNSFEMERKLLNHEIDLALVENDSSQANIRYLDYVDDEIVVVAAANQLIARQKSLTVADLQEIPIVVREKGSGTLEVIQHRLARQQIDLERLNILIHLGSTEAIKNFLLNFDGLALVSEKAIEKELQLKQLVRIKVKDLSIQRKFRFAMRQGPEKNIPELFRNFLTSYNV